MNRIKGQGVHRLLILVLILLVAACGPATQEGASLAEVEKSRLGALPEDSETAESVASPTSQLASESTTVNVQDDVRDLTPPVDKASSDFEPGGIQVGFTQEGRPYRGDPQAAVLIEEFSDYQCPFCTRFSSQTLPSLKENQIANGEVLLVFYDFPLTSIHPQAWGAAHAARCAGEQGALAYWQMHDLLFADMDRWANNNATAVFRQLAQELDLDIDHFDNCQETERFAELIQADIDLGRSLGISSTPSFFINDQPLIGAQPLSVFNQAIALVQEGEAITAAQPTQPAAPSVKPTPATISSGDFAGILGDPDAPVTIVEYTDYQCPFCQRHVQQTMPQILETMIASGRVRYALKDFPLDSIHPEARQAAAAARCAGEQEAYWEMHDLIFAEQGEWAGQGTNATPILVSIAADLGLDTAALETCLASGRYDQTVQANQDEGISLGVRGTPFFFINGFPINGAQPFELFQYAVELAEAGTLADAYVPPPQPTVPPQPTGPVDVPIGDAHSIGDPDAPVVVIEYTDYQCPFCSRHFNQTMPLIQENFIDQGLVRYVFKDFPLTSIHPQAVIAAEAARCAGDQEAYVAMHDILFARQQEWNNRDDALQLFVGYAADLELETSLFSDCLSTHKYEEAVMADLDEGVSFGVRGTPAFFINGSFLSGAQPYSVFEQAINGQLSR